MARFPIKGGVYMADFDCYTYKGEQKRPVVGDVFGVAEAIRDIEPEYFILFDVVKQKYEVHSSANLGDTYCFTVPFPELDARTIKHCWETNVRNKDNIIKMLEDSRKKFLRDKSNKEEDTYRQQAKDFYNHYALERRHHIM